MIALTRMTLMMAHKLMFAQIVLTEWMARQRKRRFVAMKPQIKSRVDSSKFESSWQRKMVENLLTPAIKIATASPVSHSPTGQFEGHARW